MKDQATITRRDSFLRATTLAAVSALGSGVPIAVATSPANAQSAAHNRTVTGVLSAVSVVDYGAKGDGVTDDTAGIQAAVNAAFGSSGAPHGTANATSNQVVYFPPGHYIITSPIRFTKIHGARVLGSGRFTTFVENTTAGSSVFVTNGCGYSRFEGFKLRTTGTGAVCFDLDWDGDGSGSYGGGLQSNTFSDMFFDHGDYGARIGHTGFMGSENLFLNCFFNAAAVAGLATENFNACQQTIIGGNFQNCQVGILIDEGAVEIVHGVGFQQTRDYDIKCLNSARDTMSITGCRSESLNFLLQGNGYTNIIDGCGHIGDGTVTNGKFVICNSPVFIRGSWSVRGTIEIDKSSLLTVQNCHFGRSDWLTVESPYWYEFGGSGIWGVIEIENVHYDTLGTPPDGKQIFKQRITNPLNTHVTEEYVCQAAPNTPAQIKADQNDYAPGAGYVQRWSANAAHNVTGMTILKASTVTSSQSDGQTYLIVNVGTQNITLKHQNASSAVGNRFLCSTGADIVLSANQAADAVYDGTQQRWLIFKRN
jgi:hypothetical protein